MQESYYIIKYKYDMGVYTLKQILDFVEEGLLSENDFHIITSYDYQGIKK